MATALSRVRLFLFVATKYGMLKLIEVTGDEPLTVAELKTSLRINLSDEDSFLSELISVAREFVEEETGLSYIDGEWEETFDGFPCVSRPGWYSSGIGRYMPGDGEIELVRGPVTDVEINYYNADNTLTTLAADQYYLSLSQRTNSKIYPVTVWPATYNRPDSVIVSYSVGWGENGVPWRAKQAVRLLAGGWYHCREDFARAQPSTSISVGLDRLLSALRPSIYIRKGH